LPAAVIKGLAERAVNQAAAQLGLVEPSDLVDYIYSEGGRDFSRLQEVSIGTATDLLHESGIPELDQAELQMFEDSVIELLRNLKRTARKPGITLGSRGSRLLAAKSTATAGLLSELRAVGNRKLFIADLPLKQRKNVGNEWVPNWARANRPWRNLGDTKLWRCGGAVFCIGGPEIGTRDIGKETLAER
jgi:hypothetical protein